MKIAFDKEKAVELKNKLEKEFPETHKREMKRYAIMLVLCSILAIIGITFFVIAGITKETVDLGAGTAIAGIMTVISVCSIAHYHDERVAEIYDYEEGIGKYNLPPCVTYLDLTNEGEVISVEQSEDMGEYKVITFYAKDANGKVITKSINIKQTVITVLDDDIQEVLDLNDGKLLVPKKIKDTAIEEIDNAYAYLKGM